MIWFDLFTRKMKISTFYMVKKPSNVRPISKLFSYFCYKLSRRRTVDTLPKVL